jgi:hypothetical protein
MRTQHNHNNDSLYGSWHLLVEKSVRMRGINSTVIGEKFMVVFVTNLLLSVTVVWNYLMLSV